MYAAGKGGKESKVVPKVVKGGGGQSDSLAAEAASEAPTALIGTKIMFLLIQS